MSILTHAFYNTFTFYFHSPKVCFMSGSVSNSQNRSCARIILWRGLSIPLHRETMINLPTIKLHPSYCYAVIMHNTIHERNLSLTLRSLISHTIVSMVYSAYSAHMCGTAIGGCPFSFNFPPKLAVSRNMAGIPCSTQQ